MAAVTIYSDFGAQENSLLLFPLFPPSIWHEVMGPDAMISVFWMLNFKPTFSLSSFAGVLPQWIQTIQREDGVGEEKLIYLIRNIKRD